MLNIKIPLEEMYDEAAEEFIVAEQYDLQLEHSLASLSKWESIWEKPFLTDDKKTVEETLSYIKCMIVTPDAPDDVIEKLSSENLKEINQYINSKMTATWFSKDSKSQSKSSEAITSELVYYWMVALQIPFECQHWHLNRLLTLIQVCNVKNSPPKKMSRREVAERQRALNAERRARLNTTG